jgi:hypothetical protein
MRQEDLENNFELTLLKELNSVKLSSEEHSSDMVDMIDIILHEIEKDELNLGSIKTHLFQMIDDLQFQDINRQKIERVMNQLIKSGSICDKILEKNNIVKSPEAKHIDGEDGEVISDEELQALINRINK